MAERLLATAYWVFFNAAERRQPLELRMHMTKLLYNRMSNLLMVGLAGLLSGVYAFDRKGDVFTLVVAVCGFFFIMLRCSAIRIFHDRLARGRSFDPGLWIVGYGVTACASSVCWGTVSFCCLVFSQDPVLYLVSVVSNTATAGAIAARNAAAPRLAKLQLLTSLLPVIAGAMFMADVGYRFLVLAVPGLIAGLFVVIGEINQQLVELYSAQMKLVGLSNTDFLTQIPNRRYFRACFSDAMAIRRTSPQPLTILMIDVDYFKGFNDLYGHPVGDCCLQRVAQQLQSSLRNTDSVLSRYGGEEFAVLLRNTTASGSTMIAQRLCDVVAGLELPHLNRADGLGVVTISIGAAATNASDCSDDEVIESADQALYRAKTLGRNRICISAAA